MSDEMNETVEGQRVQAKEELSPEQWAKLQPLMSVGSPQLAGQLTAMKPGEIKRQELKSRALEALREHGTIGHAASAAGVGVTTIYRWRDADPEFARQVLEFMHVDQVDQLHQSMYHLATNPTAQTANASVRAAEFLLKSLDREKYGDQLKTDTNININSQVQVIHEVRASIRERQAQRLKTIDAEDSK